MPDIKEFATDAQKFFYEKMFKKTDEKVGASKILQFILARKMIDAIIYTYGFEASVKSKIRKKIIGDIIENVMKPWVEEYDASRYLSPGFSRLSDQAKARLIVGNHGFYSCLRARLKVAINVNVRDEDNEWDDAQCLKILTALREKLRSDFVDIPSGLVFANSQLIFSVVQLFWGGSTINDDMKNHVYQCLVADAFKGVFSVCADLNRHFSIFFRDVPDEIFESSEEKSIVFNLLLKNIYSQLGKLEKAFPADFKLAGSVKPLKWTGEYLGRYHDSVHHLAYQVLCVNYFNKPVAIADVPLAAAGGAGAVVELPVEPVVAAVVMEEPASALEGKSECGSPSVVKTSNLSEEDATAAGGAGVVELPVEPVVAVAGGAAAAAAAASAVPVAVGAARDHGVAAMADVETVRFSATGEPYPVYTTASGAVPVTPMKDCLVVSFSTNKVKPDDRNSYIIIPMTVWKEIPEDVQNKFLLLILAGAANTKGCVVEELGKSAFYCFKAQGHAAGRGGQRLYADRSHPINCYESSGDVLPGYIATAFGDFHTGAGMVKGGVPTASLKGFEPHVAKR